MPKYDYLVVGAGMFGGVFSHEASKAGKSVLVVERRDHIGGNCYTQEIDGIHVHVYGPHIFHCKKKYLWDYVNQFAEFNNFSLRGRVRFGDTVYSFPINLMTFQQLWGINTPERAEKKLAELKTHCTNPQNFRDWIVSEVGEEIYEIFFRGYTTKQWNRDPSELPSSIVKRLPRPRTQFNDRYFDDPYEGIPVGGYTQIFQKMLRDADIELKTDFLSNRDELEKLAGRIIYTGPIDEFFDCCYGKLEYRSLHWEHEHLDGDYQGAAVVNYGSLEVPFTRIIEHKHFEMSDVPNTIITREYPAPYDGNNIPCYPVRDEKNAALHKQYQKLSEGSGVVFGGRLGSFEYYDMHMAIAAALTLAQKELGS